MAELSFMSKLNTPKRVTATPGMNDTVITTPLGDSNKQEAPVERDAPGFKRDKPLWDRDANASPQMPQAFGRAEDTIAVSPIKNNGMTDEERLAKELDESEALARQLMAEEAMYNYEQTVALLQQQGGVEGVSQEDLAAMQAAMGHSGQMTGEVPEIMMRAEEESLDYDELLELGDAIGDVKQERWALEASQVIATLPCSKWSADVAKADGANITHSKCLVCQCEYEAADEVRQLPACEHMYHSTCIEGWLKTNPTCVLCKVPVTKKKD
ncbi:unnamed protein product [Chrysoparadoxa australica]